LVFLLGSFGSSGFSDASTTQAALTPHSTLPINSPLRPDYSNW
jgi:hypothetical protein